MYDQSPEELAYLENEHGEIILPHANLLKRSILDGNELMLLPAEQNNYLVDRLLWENQIIIILAKEKVGKSLFSLQMACALSCGERFLGEFEVLRPMKVLYIQAEGDRYETINRIKAMVSEKGVKWNPDNFYHMFPPALSLDTKDGYHSLVNSIKAINFCPNIIFIDPLYMSMIGDLNDNQRARMFCRHARELQAAFNCSIIINHHQHRPVKEQKTGRYINEGDNAIMGSFVWKAFPSHVIRLQKKKDDSVVMTCDTQRSGVVITDIHLTLIHPYPLKFKIVETNEHRSDQVLKLLNMEKHGLTCDSMVNMTGLSENTIRKSITELLKENKIHRTNQGKIPLIYKAGATHEQKQLSMS